MMTCPYPKCGKTFEPVHAEQERCPHCHNNINSKSAIEQQRRRMQRVAPIATKRESDQARKAKSLHDQRRRLAQQPRNAREACAHAMALMRDEPEPVPYCTSTLHHWPEVER